MHDFVYQRPATLDEALRLGRTMFDARWLAGGHSLVPALKQRLATVGTLIDVRHLPQLQGIAVTDDHVSVGAATTHAQVAASQPVQSAMPGLAHLASCIADAQVRHMGTLGGAIAHADPAADYPAAVVACDAQIETSTRTVAAADFFRGMFETALAPGELVLRVKFRRPLACAYEKFRNPASGYATVGVFVARYADGVRVGVTGAGPGAFRWQQAEALLNQRFEVAALQGLALSPQGLNDDLHASAEYRAALAGVLLQDAVSRLLAQAERA